MVYICICAIIMYICDYLRCKKLCKIMKYKLMKLSTYLFKDSDYKCLSNVLELKSWSCILRGGACNLSG